MHPAMYAVLGLGLAGTVVPTASDTHRPDRVQAPATVAQSEPGTGIGGAEPPVSLSVEAWMARGEQRLHCQRARLDPACEHYALRD